MKTLIIAWWIVACICTTQPARAEVQARSIHPILQPLVECMEHNTCRHVLPHERQRQGEIVVELFDGSATYRSVWSKNVLQIRKVWTEGNAEYLEAISDKDADLVPDGGVTLSWHCTEGGISEQPIEERFTRTTGIGVLAVDVEEQSATLRWQKKELDLIEFLTRRIALPGP